MYYRPSLRAAYEAPHVNTQQAARDSFAILDRLQVIGVDEPLSEGRKVMALAILFREVAIHSGIGTAELLNRAERATRDAEEMYPAEIRALREYVKQEVK